MTLDPNAVQKTLDAFKAAYKSPIGDPRLAGLARWPVTISYFEVGKDSPTPTYSIAFELYENGVSRQLVIDYGEFSLRGTLSKLEWQAETACSRQ